MCVRRILGFGCGGEMKGWNKPITKNICVSHNSSRPPHYTQSHTHTHTHHPPQRSHRSVCVCVCMCVCVSLSPAHQGISLFISEFLEPENLCQLRLTQYLQIQLYTHTHTRTKISTSSPSEITWAALTYESLAADRVIAWLYIKSF